MAQIRYHNYNRKLISFDENQRFLGLIKPGVYSGWDRFVVLPANELEFHHDITGVSPTAVNNFTILPNRGLVVSRQGFFIYEDAPVSLTVAINSANPFTRIDLVIASHQYLSSVGGQPASYSVIQGASGGPVAPVLSNPASQVIVGSLLIPASASDHTGTIFIRNSAGALGTGFSFTKTTNQDVPLIQNSSLVNNFNAQVNSGIFFLIDSPSNSPTVAARWSLLVSRNGTALTQFATGTATGRSYTRSSENSGVTYTPWVNLNNPDVVVEFAPITAMIGSRLYTDENYVMDLQTLTASIDALDMGLGALSIDLDNLVTVVDNLTTNKADKAQPAWSNVDLVFGTVNIGYYPARYRITDQNRLEISARIQMAGPAPLIWGTIPPGILLPSLTRIRTAIINVTDGTVARHLITDVGADTNLSIEGAIIGKTYEIHISLPISSQT